MEVCGYATIAKDAKTANGTKNPEKYFGQDCRVMEFTPEGDVLVVAPDGKEMAMFDACDVKRKFECSVEGEYICPPNSNMLQRIDYIARIHLRKGGWAPILKQMLIQASLHKGNFNDTFLWQKQD